MLADWAAKTPWIDFFAADPATRSNTSVCLKVVDPAVTALDLAGQEAFVRAIAARLDKEGVAYDIAFHRDAPPHFRIWAGATIEASDLAALTEWLDWGFARREGRAQAGGVSSRQLDRLPCLSFPRKREPSNHRRSKSCDATSVTGSPLSRG